MAEAHPKSAQLIRTMPERQSLTFKVRRPSSCSRALPRPASPAWAFTATRKSGCTAKISHHVSQWWRSRCLQPSRCSTLHLAEATVTKAKAKEACSHLKSRHTSKLPALRTLIQWPPRISTFWYTRCLSEACARSLFATGTTKSTSCTSVRVRVRVRVREIYDATGCTC